MILFSCCNTIHNSFTSILTVTQSPLYKCAHVLCAAISVTALLILASNNYISIAKKDLQVSFQSCDTITLKPKGITS